MVLMYAWMRVGMLVAILTDPTSAKGTYMVVSDGTLYVELIKTGFDELS